MGFWKSHISFTFGNNPECDGVISTTFPIYFEGNYAPCTNTKTLFAFDRYDKSGGLLLLLFLLEAAFPLLLVKWIRGRVVETHCSKN